MSTESEALDQSDMQPDAVTAPALDAAAIARLIARRRVSGGTGPLVSAWRCLATALGLWTAYALLNARVSGPDLLWLAAYLCVPWVTVVTLSRMALAVSASQTALALPELDRSALPSLVLTLEWPSRLVRAVVRNRLCWLLPDLTEGDAGLLGAGERAYLYDSLRLREAQFSPEFVLAVLRALPVIGDEAALPAVRRLATTRGWTANLRRVRDAALACLPRLERRVAQLRLDRPETPQIGSERANAQPDVVTVPAPIHVAEVLARLQAELKSQPGMRFPFLVATWTILVPGCLLLCAQLAWEGQYLLACLVALSGAFSTQLHRFTLTERHRRIAAELEKLDDVHAVGPLAEAMGWPDRHLQDCAMSALTQLLPRMRASDGALLTSHQRACLYASLTPSRAQSRPEFVIALLKALEQVGDVAAIGPVRQLAEGSWRSARLQRVKEAAIECVPALLQAAERDQDRQLLLRPAMPPSMQPELLLRPASGIAEADPNLLLRPSVPE